MVAHAAQKSGVEGLNNFLQSVKTLKSDLESDRQFDALGAVQKVFDVDLLRADVDEAFDRKSIGGADQAGYVDQRKVVDKVLRQVRRWSG